MQQHYTRQECQVLSTTETNSMKPRLLTVCCELVRYISHSILPTKVIRVFIIVGLSHFYLMRIP